MEKFNGLDIATTLGRIWCEELGDSIYFDCLSPQNGAEIISRAANENWITYLMGKDIDRDFSKISQLAANFYEVDNLPEEIFSKIVERVRYEYRDHPQMNQS
jgi:hypothetical protein